MYLDKHKKTKTIFSGGVAMWLVCGLLYDSPGFGSCPAPLPWFSPGKSRSRKVSGQIFPSAAAAGVSARHQGWILYQYCRQKITKIKEKECREGHQNLKKNSRVQREEHTKNENSCVGNGNFWFKGTVSWDWFQKFWKKFTEPGLSKGLWWFYNSKSSFIAVNASLCWLNIG